MEGRVYAEGGRGGSELVALGTRGDLWRLKAERMAQGGWEVEGGTHPLSPGGPLGRVVSLR